MPTLIDCPAAVRGGVLRTGSAIARYYTAQPAPTQWIAVSTVNFTGDPSRPACLLVGNGRTELEALTALRHRLIRLAVDGQEPARVGRDGLVASAHSA